MIVFDLSCDQGHGFEGWFSSSEDFASQCERGMVACPQCGSAEVRKAPMAPAVPAKGNQRAATAREGGTTQFANREIPVEVQQAMRALAKAQQKALAQSKYVGDGFAEESRAMHYGEKDVEAIHGKATVKEARELMEEGIAISALPFPIAEPDELN